MAKVKKVKHTLENVYIRLSKMTDDSLSSIFHKEAFDKGQLDEKTVEVIRDRVRIYLQTTLFSLNDCIDEL